MANDRETPRAPSACRSVGDVAELSIVDVAGISAELRAGKLDGDSKRAIIEAVRGGKHVELTFRAITFRQRDGSPNKNYLRHRRDRLGELAASYAGKPFLVDHASWRQDARKGTILESELVELPHGWAGFRQTIAAVKPDAVISVLDGTIDRFSIGWDPRGAVFCSVHKVDLRSRSSCGCRPGERVTVDGRTEIVEYEWQSTEGTETSGVNNPAVAGTKIESFYTALAAELELSPPTPTRRKDHPMRFQRLLAALAIKPATLSAEASDDALDATLAEAVDELRASLTATVQERDAALERAKLAEAKAAKVAELEAKLAELEAGEIDAVLEEAYRAGKLIRGRDKEGKATPSPREARLRRIAKEPDGLAALRAELDEMPVIVPVGQRQLAEGDADVRPASGPIDASVLTATASQLGLDPKELEEHARKMRGERA